MYNFRTDMAVERRDLYKKANNIENDIDGIETEEEKFHVLILQMKMVNKP